MRRAVRPCCRRDDGARVNKKNNQEPSKQKTMEENSNMTAERSLEIITEQIAQSRKTVSKDVGQSLCVSGLCTMGMAVVVTVINIVAGNNGFTPFGHWLWMVLPIIIWLFMRNIHKGDAHTPVNFVGALVGKTWWTFAVVGLSYFLLGNLFNFIMARLLSPQEFIISSIRIMPVIMLLMAMAVSITGHILKIHWLVWFGIIGGLAVGIGSSIDIVSSILGRLCPLSTVAAWHFIQPCPSVFLFALVGLTLPGWMLKKQK